MTARQRHVPVEVAYRYAYTSVDRALVLAAYSEPGFSSQGFQLAAIDDFTTRMFVACMTQGK